MKVRCAVLLVVLAVPATTVAQKKAPEGAKVLLLSGGQRQHHGYRDQAFYLANLLEDTGRYEVTIVEDAAVLETPALRKYGVLIVTADRRDPEFKFTEGQQKAIFAFVREGGGYVSIHGGDNAPPEWLPEWREMLGGLFSHDTRGGRPDGKVRKGTYTVKIVDASSPITRGLSDFELKDELYYHIQMEPGVVPLATIAHEGQDWPVAWTRTFGKGRVFHTPLGHRDFGPEKDDPLRNASLSKLIVQGVDWVAAKAEGDERAEHFDRDPGWEGRNNRSEHFAPRTVRQDFGFDAKRHAIGGAITPAAEPASYGKVIAEKSFGDRLSASGTLVMREGGGHALVGFFNSRTLNEWRTPNTIALRIQGRGDVFYAYVEYATSRWRAGGDSPRPFAMVGNPATGRQEPRGFAVGVAHEWSLSYDPAGNDGRGVVTATIDGETAVCELTEGHKADGATFDRFGMLNVMKSADDTGELWLDDVTVNGERDGFDSDPGWEGVGNRRTFESANVRPRFDFGFSPTHFAGGKGPGELGGLVFRGDCREAPRMASYGDRVGPLTLDRPLRASGTIALRRGVSDSTTLFGFYHSERSLRVNPSQDSGWPEGFIGFAIEGPSREGFLMYPCYRTTGGHQGYANGPERPPILPDGKPHAWTFEYVPTGEGGRISLTFDGQTVRLDVPAGDRVQGVTLDRLGLVTTWIDGNGQSVFFDDLTYTALQKDSTQ